MYLYRVLEKLLNINYSVFLPNKSINIDIS
jgi:hypothetical protein